MCACAFCIAILCLDHLIGLIMADMNNLSGWLCWDEGCFMWLFSKNMLLRLFVKMKMSQMYYFVLVITISIVFSFAVIIFCSLGSLYDML